MRSERTAKARSRPARTSAKRPDSLRDFVDAIDDALCCVEVVPDASGRVVDVRYVHANPAFAAQAGVPDIEGRTASEVLPALEPHWFEHFERVWRSGEPSRFTGRADSLERWFDVRLSRLDGADGRRIACLFTDVTGEHEARERALELAAELSEANRRKTEFLATLAHELRNPLAPIGNALELVAGGDVDPVELAHLHRMMARQVGQLNRLVDALLDLSRISRDRIELQRAPVALVDVIDGAIEACGPLLEQAGHALEIERPPDDVAVDVDAVRLVQVLTNLLNNAAHYTPPGGRIAVSAAVTGGAIRVAVADDGIGLDADGLRHVFEMFNRVGGGAPREHGGLGIGLPLSRRLVELHGGELTASSDGLGKGSRFEVRIPTRSFASSSSGAEESEDDTGEGPPPRPLRVLIVDDNRDAADTLARLLGLRGHDVSVAYTGRAALEAIGDDPPDAVLLDIGLPDVTGYRVAAELHGRSWRDRTVLVALTGWGTAADRQRSRDAGFEHHLTKPVPARRVLELLAEIARGAAGRRAAGESASVRAHSIHSMGSQPSTVTTACLNQPVSGSSSRRTTSSPRRSSQ